MWSNEGDVKVYKEGTMGGNSVGGISGNNIDKGTIENAVNKGAILGRRSCRRDRWGKFRQYQEH